MVRRHTQNQSAQAVSHAPAVQTVTGNYVAAKRKGVVNGVDYQMTGMVRFVQTEAIKQQLDEGSVVLLSNLGYSAAGEVLNCDIYTVAARAAVDLHADKLIVMSTPETMPHCEHAWLTLSDAEKVLQDMASAKGTDLAYLAGVRLIVFAEGPACRCRLLCQVVQPRQ
jgi:amino-acid N-acetyltransferase